MPPKSGASKDAQLKKMRTALAKAKASSGAKPRKAVKARTRIGGISTARFKERKDPMLAGLIGAGGTALGGALGGPMGAALGSAAGGIFSKIFGFGDYKVRSNTVISGTDPPTFGTAGRGTIVRHREYLGDIISSSNANTFNIQAFPLNAAQPTTFPWLAQIADNYEQYCVRGMIFEFKSMSADALNSVNTALGSVIMATQYNSVNPAFTSKAQMENHEFATSAKPSQSFVHAIECARGETPVSCLYTRTGSVPSGADQRLYDLGTMYIATTGFQGTSVNCGELWTTYDIELLKPQLQVDGNPEGGLYDHWNLSGTLTTSHYFGTTSTLSAGSFLGTKISTAGSGTILFPISDIIQTYFIYYQITGASTALTNALAPSLGVGMTALNGFQAGANSSLALPAGTTLVFQSIAATVSVNAGVGSSFTFSAGTLPGTATMGDLWIAQLPYFSPPLLDRVVRTPSMSMVIENKSDEKKISEVIPDDSDLQEYLAFKRMMKKVPMTVLEDRDYERVATPSGAAATAAVRVVSSKGAAKAS